MRWLPIQLFFKLLLVIGLSHAVADEPTEDGEEFFEKSIRPILVEHCLECHSGERTSGGLSLDSRPGWTSGGDSGAAIIPGDPGESLLVQAVQYDNPALQMPPEDHGGKLSAEKIALLVQWVQAGAVDPRDGETKLGGMTVEAAEQWWAFQPLPNVPIGTSADIDRFLDASLGKANLPPSPPADRRSWIRRATYDLIGLPPTNDHVTAFLSDDSADAYLHVIDRLLASPRYGERWGRHWLDVVRYADTAGENTDRPLPHAWRYRNWVIEAMNRDLSYREFVRLQIAGDLLPLAADESSRIEGIIATGYLAIARRFGHDIDKDMHLTYEDVIDNLGKNFLGLTLACARCHDHKYDPVSSDDYYALYGIFASTKFSYPGCEPFGQPRDLVPIVESDIQEAELAAWNERMAKIETLVQQRQAAINKHRQQVEATFNQQRRVLVQSQVDEGATVDFGSQADLDEAIEVQKGDVILLTVAPNGNHGADSTQVQLQISDINNHDRVWQTGDLVEQLTKANPRIADDGSAWCFLESSTELAFLTDSMVGLEGQTALSKWSIGELPSVFANSSNDAVNVWTALPGQSLFVHPSPDRSVAIAWCSPAEMSVAVRGFVADIHPAALDGVSFKLEHIANPAAAESLLALGVAGNSIAIPQPEPKPQFPVAYAVMESQPRDVAKQLRGDPEQPGATVPRRWLTVFGGEVLSNGEASGRAELADWIVGHPLFARVMVNRIWQWHFGHGLVRTANDFGTRGDAVSHPELLDWLAAQFVHRGYSIKHMHRLIMNSAAYQRSSQVDPSVVERDPENRLLSHFDRRRLSAEELRDSLLAASKQLDLTPATAHPFPAESSWTYTQHNPFAAVYPTNKRSVYLMVQRQRRHPFLALFDGADPNASTPQRQATTVPTQSLYFLNNPFVHEQARAIADEIVNADQESDRTEVVYRRLLQRSPSAEERTAAMKFVSDYSADPQSNWAAWIRVMMASNEFIYLD